MGFGGVGFKELLLILVIALVIFGSGKLKTMGSDLGNAVKGFRKAMDHEGEKEPSEEDARRIEESAAPDARFAEQKDKTSGN